MNKKILVLNGGSSSIKFQLMDYDSLNLLAAGICERIFVDGNFICKFDGKKVEQQTQFNNHEDALNYLIKFLEQQKIITDKKEIVGIGHRIVHGGSKMDSSKIVNNEVRNIIKDCIKFAPLHNEPELLVLDISMKVFNEAKHVASFDTAFHHSIPNINKRYAICNEWENELGIKRYGAHGISYNYITNKMEELLNKKKVNLIVCHLGNGASICAIKDSVSINTSMGLTPLEGLIMGTRSGDIDPSVIKYVSHAINKSVDEITDMLNKKSGMLGLTGYSDFRDICNNLYQPQVKEAFDIYCKRITNYIVRYLNDLDNKCDAIVFSAGVGENTPLLRTCVIEQIKITKLAIDEKSNNEPTSNGAILISSTKSSIPIYVVNTNEELMIAKDIKKLIK